MCNTQPISLLANKLTKNKNEPIQHFQAIVLFHMLVSITISVLICIENLETCIHNPTSHVANDVLVKRAHQYERNFTSYTFFTSMSLYNKHAHVSPFPISC